jgi:cytochrome c biogenesis protein
MSFIPGQYIMGIAYSKIYRALSSLKTAIVLLSLLILLALLSTVIPQHAAESVYLETYGRFLGTLVLFLQLDTIFQSALFILLLALFFSNTLFCTVRRIRRVTVRRPAVEKLRRSDFVFTSRIQDPERTLRILKRRGYRKIGDDDADVRWLGYRGILAKVGVDVVHCAVLLVILGGLTSALTKRESFVWLREGEKVDLPSGQALVLSRFDYLRYEDGTPRDWLSHVTVTEDGTPVRDAVVEVNHPLRHEGYQVYQTSYAFEYILTLRLRIDGTETEHEVAAGGVIIRDDLFLHVVATGDAPLSETRIAEITEKSVFALDIYRNGEFIEQLPLDENIDRAESIELQAALISAESNLASGLTIRREAGFFIVVAAFVLITVGLFMNFYMSEKIVKVEWRDGAHFLSGGFVKGEHHAGTREWERASRSR